VSAPCRTPVSDETLLGWWGRELPPLERARLEEHLLSCEACSAKAEALHRLARGVRDLVRRGELPVVMPPSVVELLRREGRRIREYRVPPGRGVRCTVGPDDDVVLARLSAELQDVAQLDLVSRVDDGPEHRLSDLPFDPSTGEVIIAPSADVLRARPAHVERLRLLAVGPEGDRLLGEYTFTHTPWPGAPA
jgi:hypothetical protein